MCIRDRVSVEEDTAMQNHEAIEAFYADYLDGQDSMVTVFEVQRDGLIGAVTFKMCIRDSINTRESIGII